MVPHHAHLLGSGRTVWTQQSFHTLVQVRLPLPGSLDPLVWDLTIVLRLQRTAFVFDRVLCVARQNYELVEALLGVLLVALNSDDE